MGALESTECILCGNNSAQYLYTISDLLLERSEIVATFVQCQNCGLTYQNPRPSFAEMAYHYPPHYESYADPEEQAVQSLLMRKAFAYGLDKRYRFIAGYRSSGRLLDIGCATGTFLHKLQQEGNWEVYGVEVNSDVAERAKYRYNLNIHAGTVEDAAYPDNFFDVVTMWDVLEHLHDPVTTLREIRRILTPDGLVVTRVPNGASWDARIFKQYWAGFDAPRHLYVFTPRTLSLLLRKTGFNILKHTTHIGGYPTFILSIRFALNAWHVNPFVKHQIAKALYHPFMRLASAPLFFIPSTLGFGPLLVSIATPRQIESSNNVRNSSRGY